MRICYDEREDILRFEFSNEPVVKDVSHGWNVNIGYGEHGIVELVILDAKAKGYWPPEDSHSL